MNRKEKYHYLKNLGICVGCGKSYAVEGKTLCMDCAEERRIANAKYHSQNRERQNEKARAYTRARYHERRNAGLCPRCGKQKPEPNRVYCAACTAKKAEEHKRSAAKSKNRIEQEVVV